MNWWDLVQCESLYWVVSEKGFQVLLYSITLSEEP